ncbi:MAG: family 78 glycoside hydrolase catalytic domain [Clostridia bacterium]|nr:family 78 glycoside hydrolase catalytic domain [Clostridia bacterium]
MNVFTKKFISPGFGAGSLEKPHPAPLIRKSFNIEVPPKKATLTVTGIGFYRLFVNGCEITRGLLSPYITDPGHVVAFDRYDIKPHLTVGENVIGLILGSGFRAPILGNAATLTSSARGDVMCALVLDLDGDTIECDESFKVHPSPILMNDLRYGEHYDARLEKETDGWTLPGFDDSRWTPAVPCDVPRGEQRLCASPPIKTRFTLTPVRIWREDDAFVYDFGRNGAGLLCLHTDIPEGRRIAVEFAEYLMDGKFYNETIAGGPTSEAYPFGSQNYIYVSRGGEQHYKTSFTYQGFRYAKVHGITEDEATPELFTFDVMSSETRERGGFVCSDEILNAVQSLTREATHSNLFHIPTDCPHREKNGWTADTAVSAVHMLINLECEELLSEWMHSVVAAVAPNGAMQGCVPSAPELFYNSWCGPGWDSVLVEVPYRLMELRDDLRSARLAAPHILRYLVYTLTKRDERGIVSFGLHDWMPPHDTVKAPRELTDTLMCIDIARKAALIHHRLGMSEVSEFCLNIARGYRDAVREHLMDKDTCIMAGACQTSQSMAINFGVFEECELPMAFAALRDFVRGTDYHVDCGVLGMRHIFRALSYGGDTELAYKMIVNPTAPSYADMVRRGETTLAEDFNAEGERINSRNHHFLGDVSAWFIDTVCGIRVNPQMDVSLGRGLKNGRFSHFDGAARVDIVPHMPRELDFAEAYHETPYGKVKVRLEKVKKGWISVKVTATGDVYGKILPPEGYHFDGCGEYILASGEYDAFAD